MFEKTKNTIISGDNYLKISSLRYIPRWVVFSIDICISIVSILLSFWIYSKILYTPFSYIFSLSRFLGILSISVLFMYVFKTFSGIIRHSTFIDIERLFWMSLLSLLSIAGINYVFYWTREIKLYPTWLLILNFALFFVFLLIFRLTVKQTFHFLREIRRSTLKRRVLILGISDQSVAIAMAIMENPHLPYEVVGFLTKRLDSRNAKLLGKKIITQDKLISKSKESLLVDGVIIIRENLDKEQLEEWVNVLYDKDIKIYKAPSVQKLREDVSNTSINNLKIEDLLHRKPIKIENEEVKKRHYQKEILVTGGAGSIGSEIVNLVAQFEPSLIVVVDQAETPLHSIELEMLEKHPKINFEFILADVSNKESLDRIFSTHNFSMVYHAAAYKHVPIIEQHPHEGVRVNILGTRNVAELSSKYRINRFVMVSTDKAVNPTNVMGATKRVAELFVQSLQKQPGNITKFITTRFGNVLGSNGSVIPHFQKQIEKGGPITITHPEITRYFMTIPEACELVLQAGTMGQGGEIYVFDMGEPVKIIDLAKRMIKLYGLETGVDIDIVVTGLRPGEKLFEELLSDDAKTLPTHHEKIMISKDPIMSFEDISALVNQITLSAIKKEKSEVVLLLKNIVPEYKSQNSEYEKLDKS